MNGRRNVARPIAAGLIVAAALLLGGCVYLRLLELKHQIAHFDANFVVQTDDGVRIICTHPVLLDKDVRWLGLAPETSRRIGTAEQWQVRWVKQLPSGVSENRDYDIVIQLLFVSHKLKRVSIPQRYFAVMPKTLLVDLLRSLGGAAVNKTGRSVDARLAAAPPNLPDVEKLFGRPTAEGSQPGETWMRYRYVPATHRGLARKAVFDMTVHLDPATGRMLHWEGRTPVGTIRFNFDRR